MAAAPCEDLVHPSRNRDERPGLSWPGRSGSLRPARCLNSDLDIVSGAQLTGLHIEMTRV